MASTPPLPSPIASPFGAKIQVPNPKHFMSPASSPATTNNEDNGPVDDSETQDLAEDDLTPEEMEILKTRIWQWLNDSPDPSEMVQIGQIGLRR